MTRELRTADQIRAELIHRLREPMGEHVADAQLGHVYPARHLGNGGCNWSVEYFGSPRHYVGAYGKALAETQRRFDLAQG